MSAAEYYEDGAIAAEEFDAYEGMVTFANVEGSMYVHVDDFGRGEELGVCMERKGILRMAHWIIKEFG